MARRVKLPNGAPCCRAMHAFYPGVRRHVGDLIACGAGRAAPFARVVAAPQVQRQQGTGAGAHGVRLLAGVMNRRSRRPLPPYRVALLPSRGAAQRQVDFLGFVTVAGIVGGRAQEQKAAGDPLARQRTARAENFAPSVVVEKSARRDRARCRSGATPATARRRTRQPTKSHAERRGVAGMSGSQRSTGRAAAGTARCRRRARPIRKKRSERGLPQGFQQLLASLGDIVGRRSCSSPWGTGYQLYWPAGIPAVRRVRAAQVFVDRGIDSSRLAGVFPADSIRQCAAVGQWIGQRHLGGQVSGRGVPCRGGKLECRDVPAVRRHVRFFDGLDHHGRAVRRRQEHRRSEARRRHQRGVFSGPVAGHELGGIRAGALAGGLAGHAAGRLAAGAHLYAHHFSGAALHGRPVLSHGRAARRRRFENSVHLSCACPSCSTSR